MNRCNNIVSGLIAAFTLTAAAQAAHVTYQIDPSRSELALSGAVRYYFNGSVFGFSPQGEGSLLARFGGTISGTLSDSTLTLAGGSSITGLANTAGPFLPLGPGAVDVYGITTWSNNGMANNRMFDITLDLPTGAATHGAPFAGSVAYTGQSAGIFPFFSGSQTDALSLAGITSANTSAAPVSLSADGPVETLIIPIDAQLILFGNGTGVETRLTGSIVATRLVPAPGAASLLALGLLGAARRRRA